MSKNLSCVVDTSHSPCRKSFVSKNTDIYVCPDCGCIMADVDFNHGQYETADYYTMQQKTVQDIENLWGFRWRHILNSILTTGEISSLLDVGAGNGYFVYLASNEFSLQTNGLEISKEEIQFAKDVLNVQLTDEDVIQHDRQYDVVTCFNVLEHVSSPRMLLAALAKSVKPGGVLAITTPNPACIHAKIKGLQNWSMIDPPHHINLFTRKSLGELIAQQDLEPIRYETLSTYINFVRKFDSNGLILRKLFFCLLKTFNLGADHFLISRRPLSA